jgi:hypothetical protein
VGEMTQVDDLYRDINDALKRSKQEEYFLGTIVLAAGADGRHSIIDGQQTSSISSTSRRSSSLLTPQRRSRAPRRPMLATCDIHA